MEPEMSQRGDSLPSGHSAGPTTGTDIPPAHSDAPRNPRVTRALEPDSALDGAKEPARAPVERSAWLRDDDYYVRKTTYMSATGRRPGDRLVTRPLPRPERFRPPSPLRSVATLSLVIALIIIIPIGVVMAGNAASHFTIPSTIPGITQPTATPTLVPTHAPTATPKKKR